MIAGALRRSRSVGSAAPSDGREHLEAWNAYLAEGNARQARKRVSADAIVRDSSGRILLVDPTYKPDWDLPGGMAEANEPPADALRREDLLNFIFDGGNLNDSESVLGSAGRGPPVRWSRPVLAQR